MKTLILFLSLVSLHTLMAQSVMDLDAKYGFRDISLGAPKETLKIASAEPQKPDGTQTVYLKRSDLTFNGMPLTFISCDLFQDRVYKITVFGSVANRGRERVTGYIKFLRDLFGRPTSESSRGNGSTVTEWAGSRVQLEVLERYIETAPGPAYQITMKITALDAVEQVKVNQVKAVKDGF